MLLYSFIGADMPFEGRNEEETKQAIVNQELIFGDAAWDDVSNELKDLIRGMLVKNQHLRLSIGEVRMHPWLS